MRMKTPRHFIKFLRCLKDPESQVTNNEQSLLLTHARDCKMVVEIGCYEGKTTAALAQVAKGVVYSIDPFPPGRMGVSYGEQIARIYCRRRGIRNARFVKGLSFDVASDFNHQVDFLFIDGDRRYEAIKQDWVD